MHIFDGEPNIWYTCGYCSRDVTVPVAWRWLTPSGGAHVALCSNCNQTTVFNVGAQIGILPRRDGTGDHARDLVRQLPQPEIIEFSEGLVPEAVARRFRDAQRARQRELWEQAISSARTAVQVMARLEDVKRGSLFEEIERLIKKRGGELPELVKAMAHRIRDPGNETLHPDDPNWTPAKEEADEALVFLQATIEWLYVMPEQLRRAEIDEQEIAESAEANASVIEN